MKTRILVASLLLQAACFLLLPPWSEARSDERNEKAPAIRRGFVF
jgi:hypothetical protein